VSVLLWVIAAWLALDALCWVGGVGKTVRVTRSMAVSVVVVRAFFVTVLVIAAVGGVTP
jgi:hypothetical protein